MSLPSLYAGVFTLRTAYAARAIHRRPSCSSPDHPLSLLHRPTSRLSRCAVSSFSSLDSGPRSLGLLWWARLASQHTGRRLSLAALSRPPQLRHPRATSCWDRTCLLLHSEIGRAPLFSLFRYDCDVCKALSTREQSLPISALASASASASASSLSLAHTSLSIPTYDCNQRGQLSASHASRQPPLLLARLRLWTRSCSAELRASIVVVVVAAPNQLHLARRACALAAVTRATAPQHRLPQGAGTGL